MQEKITSKELRGIKSVLEINEYDYLVVKRKSPEFRRLLVGLPQCSNVNAGNFDEVHLRGIMEQEGFVFDDSYFNDVCRRFYSCVRFGYRTPDCMGKERIYEFSKRSR